METTIRQIASILLSQHPGGSVKMHKYHVVSPCQPALMAVRVAFTLNSPRERPATTSEGSGVHELADWLSEIILCWGELKPKQS